MPKATKPLPRAAKPRPAPRRGADTARLDAAMAAPVSADSLRAAAAEIDRSRPKTRAEVDAMLLYVVTNFSPVLSGGADVLVRMQQEMTEAAKTMDEGGTVMNWAGMISLVVAAFDRPAQDIDACLHDRAAAGGAA